MQTYEYDTKKAKQLGVLRSPEYDLQHRGWEGVKMSEPDENGIISFTAEKVKIDLFNIPKHINPVAYPK